LRSSRAIPRYVPALGFTPLAQSLARHASQRTRPRVPGETTGSLMRPAGPARTGLAERLSADRRCADSGRRARVT
jgi:hypothetical protein